MTVEIGGHLLLAPASIAATAVAVALSLVLVRLAQQTAGARALRTLALVIGHQTNSCINAVRTQREFRTSHASARIISVPRMTPGCARSVDQRQIHAS